MENNTQTLPYQRNMMLLLSGRLVSNLMTQAFIFAQGLYVMDLTGSATAFSAVLIAAMIPRAIFNFFAGVLVDRLDQKKLIVGCDLAMGLITFGFLALFLCFPQSLALFIVLSLVLGAINTLFVIAVQAATPQMVGDKLVLKANALQQSMKSLIFILGPMLGALSYGYSGMKGVFVMNGVSFLLSGISEMMIRFRARKSVGASGVLDSFRQVWQYFGANPVLKNLFLVAIAMQVFFEPMVTLVLPFVAYKILEVSEFQLSLIQGLASLGVIAAGVLLATRKKKGAYLHLFFVLLIIQGVLFMGWSFPALNHQLAMSAWVLTGIFTLLQLLGRFFNTIQNVPLFSHFQVAVPEEIRGRVFGFFYSIAFLVVPLSLWLFGFLLEMINWVWIPIIAGGCVIFIALIFMGKSDLRHWLQHIREAE